MRLQSAHALADRGPDAYFSPPAAAHALLAIEASYLPHSLWEPAAGDGALVLPLRAAGHSVVASDLYSYDCPDCTADVDYLEAPALAPTVGIVTNPPYRLALDFARKALSETAYLALLLRTNFLESTTRLPFFRQHPPARIWISSRRFPMMHRHGWIGPIAPSNTCFAWFIWDRHSEQKRLVDWFDWADFTSTEAPDFLLDNL